MLKQSTFLRRVLKALQAAGYTLDAVDDGGDANNSVGNSVEKTIEACRAVDDATIYVSHPEKRSSHLWVIWQGPDDTYASGEEIVADYGVSLEPVLQPLYQEVGA